MADDEPAVNEWRTERRVTLLDDPEVVCLHETGESDAGTTWRRVRPVGPGLPIRTVDDLRRHAVALCVRASDEPISLSYWTLGGMIDSDRRGTLAAADYLADAITIGESHRCDAGALDPEDARLLLPPLTDEEEAEGARP